MNPYTIRIEHRSEKELRALPSKILKRVDNAIAKLSLNPRPRGAVKLKGLAEEGWRIRVGDYRILYRIIDEEHVIEIYRIKHRGQVYR